MSEVHRLPESDRIDREASEWIARSTLMKVQTADAASSKHGATRIQCTVRSYDDLMGTWHRSQPRVVGEAVSLGTR